VQAIMNQTLRRSVNLEEFGLAFEGRLKALADAHDLALQEQWRGTELGQVVHQILAPYRGNDPTRITADGPNVALRPQAGVALAMILHELATNAAKYGSLSVPTGRIAVTWELKQASSFRTIHFYWVEIGGPKVLGASRQGFGTRLIGRTAALELEGEAKLDYQEAGLRFSLSFPWLEPDPPTQSAAGH
jgi:two-component system CheB/CheR fusion protein